MAYDKHYALANRLYEKTVSGEKTWEETAQDDVFQLNFAKYSVRIRQKNVVNQDYPDYIIEIYDKDGAKIDSYSDQDLDNSGNEYFNKLEEIYETARRQALGTDQAIDEIIAELDDDIPF